MKRCLKPMEISGSGTDRIVGYAARPCVTPDQCRMRAMEETPSRSRITYSPGYLAAVFVMAALNMFVFHLLADHLVEPGTRVPAKLVLSVFFGILFAGGCNLTALALARWTSRRELADRILMFLLIELAGLTLLALGIPLLADSFWQP